MEPKKLARLLVERKLVEKFAVDQALVKLKAKQTLADRLVADALITEADLLRAIAQSTGTKFISSARLSDLMLSPQVLGMIPLAVAQEHDVLPIAFDSVRKALTVVIVDPQRLSALDDLPTVGKLDHVIANVSMPAAIRLAIRRVYGLDRKGAAPPPPQPSGKCSECKEPYFEDQLECANCGLLLNPDAPTDTSDARIVRALLSQPSGLHKIVTREQVLEGTTRKGFKMQVTDEQCPELVAGIDIARSLSEFEAFVISFIDGQLTIGELSQSSGLMTVEVHSVVASLTERKVLKLREPGPPGVTAPAPPSARLVNQSKPPPERPKSAETKSVPPPAQARGGPLESRDHDPQLQMENSLQHALTLERRGQVDGAISVLRTAVSRAPHPAPLYNRLALVILNQRRDARQAEQLLLKALELEPDNAVYRANLMKVLNYAATRSKH